MRLFNVNNKKNEQEQHHADGNGIALEPETNAGLAPAEAWACLQQRMELAKEEPTTENMVKLMEPIPIQQSPKM